ncbi:MAG: hypothetical protein PUP91_06040 [Rhizonema sp. PD37]|nr:hypothetical protein [Rhizonema sp. PD37]
MRLENSEEERTLDTSHPLNSPQLLLNVNKNIIPWLPALAIYPYPISEVGYTISRNTGYK